MFVEKKYVNFSVEGTTVNKIIRVLIGVLILLILQTGLKVILPMTNFCIYKICSK